MKPPLESELHAFVDGRLDPARAAELSAWLAQDAAAMARVHAYRAQKEALHAAFDDILEEAPPPRLVAAAQRSMLRRLRPLAVAACWLGLGFVAGHGLRTTGDRPGMQALAQRAAVAHAVYAPEVRHPVEVGAEQEAHLVQWLSRRLGTSLKTPRLGALGFDLVGGRLLPGQDGPVAQFMYQDGSGRRLTLYVGHDREHEASAFRYAQEGKLAVFYWLDGRFGYALSGELPRAELLRLAEIAYRDLTAIPPAPASSP